jgi:hypothetical protein
MCNGETFLSRSCFSWGDTHGSLQYRVPCRTVGYDDVLFGSDRLPVRQGGYRTIPVGRETPKAKDAGNCFPTNNATVQYVLIGWQEIFSACHANPHARRAGVVQVGPSFRLPQNGIQSIGWNKKIMKNNQSFILFPLATYFSHVCIVSYKRTIILKNGVEDIRPVRTYVPRLQTLLLTCTWSFFVQKESQIPSYPTESIFLELAQNTNII